MVFLRDDNGEIFNFFTDKGSIPSVTPRIASNFGKFRSVRVINIIDLMTLFCNFFPFLKKFN